MQAEIPLLRETGGAIVNTSSGAGSEGSPAVGLLELHKEELDLPDPGQSLAAYVAPPGSRTADSLDLLASWAATHRAQHDIEQAGT